MYMHYLSKAKQMAVEKTKRPFGQTEQNGCYVPLHPQCVIDRSTRSPGPLYILQMPERMQLHFKR